MISVVIPIGPGEESWEALLSDLHALPPDSEVLLTATVEQPAEFQQIVELTNLCCRVRWITSDVGRARQLNCGAEETSKEWLWFLHADTRVPADTLLALESALTAEEDLLYYFNLEFRSDGPAGTRWNTRGVRFRSDVLGMPFGDQGFCLRRETLERLGGFDESATYGEDHLLVWAARRNGVPLRQIDATITTSARKYAEQGWLRTTLVHVWRTARQALPEWWKWVRS